MDDTPGALPAGAIIIDESLTSGGTYWDQSAGCPRFSHLTLTGGAIGFGPPAALGKAHTSCGVNDHALPPLFSHLTLTGGAVGFGPPTALGKDPPSIYL